MTGLPDIERRLRRLEDLEQIRQLFVDYVRYLDAGDFAAYSQLSAERGEVILGPLGSATGHSAIRGLLDKALGSQGRGMWHIIANPGPGGNRRSRHGRSRVAPPRARTGRASSGRDARSAPRRADLRSGPVAIQPAQRTHRNLQTPK
jgi:SnoaL-like domain